MLFRSREVEVECLPGDIPDVFTVEVSELSIGQSFRVGELKVDNRKLRVLTDPSQVIAHVVAPRAAEEEKPAEEAVAAVGEVAAEPEVIRKGKAEAAGEEVEAAPAAEGEKKEKEKKK